MLSTPPPHTMFERDRILLHIAVSSPADASVLSRRIGIPKAAVQDDINTLMNDGSVFVHEGALRASAAATIVSAAPPETIQGICDQVIAEAQSTPNYPPTPLGSIAEAGCTNGALLTLLINAHGKHPKHAGTLSAIQTVARARGLQQAELDLLLAHAAITRGAIEQALALTDPLITHNDPRIMKQAAVLAAAAHIPHNRFERAEALYRHIGIEEAGDEAAWAVIAMIGSGNIEEARIWRASMPEHPLTSHASGLIDIADGVLLSVTGSGDGALDLLARALNTLAPLGEDVILPESPAALAALVAIGRGEPEVAQMILERALSTQLGGVMNTRRHQLLLSWSLMAQGRMNASERILGEVGPVDVLNDRDALLYRCLQAGIARRRTDVGGMRDAWNEVRGQTFGMQLTLYDLLPLGEMMVIAARMRDQDRMHDMVQHATALIARLGGATPWAAPLHWHGVLAAFQAEDPASLLPHAQALTTAGLTNPYAEILAQAGNTWLEVLRRKADFSSVEASVRALARNGHAWDASRLAGQAALQHPEREGSLAMMQLARDITKEHQRQTLSASASSVLTSREMEVGRLVLDGQGYRAIGQQLFISPKTVEHHVARMRTRLGATSRSDLLEKLHDVMTSSDH